MLFSFPQSNGPIQVAFYVYGEFESYKGGIYKTSKSELASGPEGGHAVKMIGWGAGPETDADGTKIPYWLIANSWCVLVGLCYATGQYLSLCFVGLLSGVKKVSFASCADPMSAV